MFINKSRFFSLFFLLLIFICGSVSEAEVLNPETPLSEPILKTEQKQITSTDLTTATESPYQDFWQFWQQNYTSILKQPDGLEAQELKEKFHNLGLKRSAPVCLLLSLEAIEAIKIKDFTRAKELLDLAREFNKYVPWTYEAEAFLDQEQSLVGFIKAWQPALKGYWLSWQDFWTAITRLGQILTKIFYSYFVFFIFCVLLAFLKYRRYLWHEFFELIAFKNMSKKSKASSFFLVPLFLVILLFPFWLSILWGILWWLLLIWVYLNRKEKWFFGVLVTVWAFLPLLLNPISNLASTYQDEILGSVLIVKNGGWHQQAMKTLESVSQDDPNAFLAHFSLGLMNQRKKDYSKAIIHYQAALDKEPNSYNSHNNLGNIYLDLERYQEAQDHYQKAIQAGKNPAEAHYNLSLLYTRRMLIEDAVKELEIAKKLQPELILKIQEYKKPVEINLSYRELLLIAFQNNQKGENLKLWLWKGFLPPLRPTQTPLVLVLWGLILLFIYKIREHQGISYPCLFCSCAICDKCTKETDSKQYCQDCLTNFKEKATQGEDQKGFLLSKAEKILSSEERIKFWVNLFLPGSDKLYENKLKYPSYLLFLWIYIFLSALNLSWGFSDPRTILKISIWGQTLWNLILVLLIYIILNISLFKRMLRNG